MENSITVITGTEKLSMVENDQLKVLIKFYKAFNQGDMELMQRIWLNSSEASMNNPVGGIKRGWDEIRAVYDKIFNGSAKVYVEFYDFTLHATENMFFATGRERGYFEKDGLRIELAIRTSRIFVRSEGEWKHIQHHGSIDDPELLKKYQQAIRS
ncbi:MAG: nuclear transport factor 2 family protein [Prolixibacteraceae bacterium]|jgi:ketosteroid isomerase-like protein|nr:nuclear transport factor 2 family protein [Prolixibacteraceae bacterium]